MFKIKLTRMDAYILAFNIIVAPVIIYVSGIVFASNLATWIHGLAILLTVTIFVQLISLYMIGNNDIFSIIYLILSYSFHLGHIVLLYFAYDFGDTFTNLPFLRIGIYESMSAMELSYYCIYALYAGILCIHINSKYQVPSGNYSFLKFNIPENEYLSYGILLIILCLPVYLLQSIAMIQETSSSGYGNVEGANVYLSVLASMYVPGGLLCLSSNDISIKKARILLFLFICISLISMLSGRRAYNLMYVFLFTVTYMKRIKFHFKIKSFFVGIMIAYVVSMFLSAIREVREKGMSLQLLTDALSGNENYIFSMINENAITGNVVANVIQYVHTPHYGAQLLTSFFIIIPGVSYLFPGIDFSKLNVVDALDAWNLGGSYIADFYFDFGFYGAIIATFIFGLIIAKFFCFYSNGINKVQGFLISFYALPFCEFLLSVRSTLYKIPRDVFLYIFYYFSLYIFYKFCKEKLKNKGRI